MSKEMSIQFGSAAYRMLKVMPGKLWFVFAEFIDNSISSYIQNKDKLEKIHGKDFQLKIEISFDDDDSIIISDNAAGIDSNDWKRALMPGALPEDTTKFNEFGMGMKYSAVWLSNYWTLETVSLKDNLKREVAFDYLKVIKGELKTLPYKDSKIDGNKYHGTTLTMTKLESGRIKPFPRKRMINHLTSIYRNFIREGGDFYDKYKVDGNIEIRAFNEVLTYEEHGFLNEQWHDDRHKLVPIIKSPKIEWKYSFSELIKNPSDNQIISFSGFIGILPKENKFQNGFSLFRRGRVVEGSGDERIYPHSLTKEPSSYLHKRLYGEFHFDDTEDGKVESTFNKSSFQDRDFIEYCIDQLPNYLKNVSFPEYEEKEFNLLTQTIKHRANFDPDAAEKAIKRLAESEQEKAKDKQWLKETNQRIEKVTAEDIKKEDDQNIVNKGNIIPDVALFTEKNPATGIVYNFTLKYYESIDPYAHLYEITVDKDLKRKDGEEYKSIDISINLKHRLFEDNQTFRTSKIPFNMIIQMIKCLCFSEVVAKDSGAKQVHYMKNTINKFIDHFIYE